jgi:hypothetical protein
VRVFLLKFTLEDAIGSQACSLEANMRVNNDIPLGCSLFLPIVHTINCVQTLKVLKDFGAMVMQSGSWPFSEKEQSRIELPADLKKPCQKFKEWYGARCSSLSISQPPLATNLRSKSGMELSSSLRYETLPACIAHFWT